MKRLLSTLLASTMILSSLSMSFATEANQTTPEETLQKIQTKTLSTSLSPEVAAAYAGVIEDIILQYGDSLHDHNAFETEFLMGHLLDVDGDGTDELYVSYFSEVNNGVDAMGNDWHYKSLTEELWAYTASGLEKVWSYGTSLTHNETYTRSSGTAFLPHNDKILLVTYEVFQGDTFTSDYRIHEYSNGTMEVPKLFLAYNTLGETDDLTLHYSIDGMDDGMYNLLDFISDDWETILNKYATFNFLSLSDQNYDVSKLQTVGYMDNWSPFWDYANPLPQLQAIASTASVSDQLNTIKSQLPYTGDISTMNMTAEQALVMAERIESDYAKGLKNFVALFDDGTRVPAMIVHDNSKDAFDGYFISYGITYNDDRNELNYNSAGKATYYVWNKNKGALEDIGLIEGDFLSYIVVEDDKTLLYGSTFRGDFSTAYYPRYSLNGGQLERDGYSLLVADYEYTPQRFQSQILSLEEEYNLSTISYDENHISFSNNTMAGMYIMDGVSVPYEDFYILYDQQGSNVGLYVGTMIEKSGYGNWDYGNNVASLLRQYAELTQFRFKFPEFSQKDEITHLFDALQLAGTMLECYQITDHFYYVIMEENGVEKGYLICAVKENGEVVYKIVSESTEILSEDVLFTEGSHYSYDSNIYLPFEEIKVLETNEEYVSYFTKALQNITGIQLNDQGKSELALSMQDSIVNFATYMKTLDNETGEIHQGEVAPLVEKSNSLYQDFLELLRAEQAELNKELDQTVRVVLQGLDEKNWTIYLNPDLIGQLQGNHLQVFLSSGQQGVELSAQDLEALLEAHNGLFINVQETGNDQYAVSFADGEGNNIEKLDNPVKIYLPTSNEFSTVILEYAQGTENWGGQFNSGTNTIQFSTIHAGTYLVLDNSVEIFDVSHEYLSMVQFMVSKGFFSVDDNGNFNPYGTMTRNDFTKIIVSMFFALDHDLKSSFPDVYEDSPYYSYIASGEARDIVAGYDDGYFHGDIVLTEEMAFTSIAQTLVDKKGYIYPEDIAFYLNSVSGGNTGSDWSERNIALSVRDAIIFPLESIHPTEEISRQNAAVYLYRLFMLLEEKQQINFELVEEITLSQETSEDQEYQEDTNNSPMMYGAILGTLAVAGIGFSIKGKKQEEQP